MGDLSLHFSSSEFRCKCDYPDCDATGKMMSGELVAVLELVRDHYTQLIGKPCIIKINSGHRCQRHNHDVGGSPGSQHLSAKAADIRVIESDAWVLIEPTVVAAFLDRIFPDKYGIGNYDTFTHIDVRHEKARW